MKKTLLLSVILLVLIPQLSEAQLLGKLKRAVQDKVEQKIEDRIVEELSEELARRAMKPIDKAFDEFLKSSYEEETGEKWDQAKFDSVMTASGEAYMDFLGGMNKAANVSDEYVFDVILDIETQEESKEKMKTKMFFGSNNNVMGFHQAQDGEDMYVVMDPDNDLMVMFNNKDKKAQAMPSMFKLSSAIVSAHIEEDDYKLYSFEATGKTKKIAGYNSKEFKGETKDMNFKTYISSELPFDWKDLYGGLIKAISPKMYNYEGYKEINGMMMKSESYDKETKKKSKWEVKKVSMDKQTIKKADFNFTGLES